MKFGVLSQTSNWLECPAPPPRVRLLVFVDVRIFILFEPRIIVASIATHAFIDLSQWCCILTIMDYYRPC